MSKIIHACRHYLVAFTLAAGLIGIPAHAQQVETFDPDSMIDGDLGPGPAPVQPAAELEPVTPVETRSDPVDLLPEAVGDAAAVDGDLAQPGFEDVGATAEAAEEADEGFRAKHLVAEAEGLFGDGSEGVARLIEDILRDQGEPNGYIVGGEGGGAFIFGVRYGKGELYHKVEGHKTVYWTGPSVGFDVGGNAGKTFVLVYNLWDTEDLYKRFPAGEGQAYFVGGMHASYLRQGDVVLIPIRMGAGLRLGVNAGYMKFSKSRKILPF
jgi:hypothetical protein